MLFILFPVDHSFGKEIENKPGQLIRVGVFDNPPVAFKDDDGQWRGISIDVLQAIANDEGWVLEFVPGSFSSLLNKFDERQIDIISMMAYSTERANKYTFTSNSLISNWGLIYSRTDFKIGSLLDLQGKRVAVMQNNIHDRAFRKLAKEFDLEIEIIELANFSDVMDSVSAGEADAGVVNRLFGALNSKKHQLVETGIIFNPINIHYAALDSRYSVILDVIDQHLIKLKSDKDSAYYNAIHRWMNPSEKHEFPQWLIWFIIGLFAVITLMIGLAMLLRKQVTVRTQELQLEVNERRLAQSQLNKLAYYDSLTDLPNRTSLIENIKTTVAGARRRNCKCAVLFIDIDRFKTINDSLGHEAGDQLIIHVAKQLQACLRDGDTINRFGGDEFVAILQDVYESADIHSVTDRMLKCLRAPIDIGVTEIYSSVSIGIALYPDDDDKGNGLLKYADAAMYHAKEKGGDNYQFYNAGLTQRVHDRLKLETRLRHALERDEFFLHYQPIFNLATQKPVGVEALIRWQDPDLGLIPPDHFIPLAEETGLIVPIGQWVMEHACTQVHEWEKRGLGPLYVAVNIASRQLEQKHFYSNVMTALHNSGLNAQQLKLEVTERMFLNFTDNVRETLTQFRSEGVQLSIDDFGTGYSSLSYLKKLPIDTLKIDRSFITGIPENTDDVQIAKTIVTMAHGMGMDVVAEGIETEDQLNFLKSLGCEQGQGYYLFRPQPADEIETWLKNIAFSYIIKIASN